MVLHTLKSHTGCATCIQFSANGRLLATGGQDARVFVYSYGTDAQPSNCPPGPDGAIDFDKILIRGSKQSKVLEETACTDPGNTIQNRGKPIAKLHDHTLCISRVVWREDEGCAWLLTASEDATVAAYTTSTAPTAPYDVATRGKPFNPGPVECLAVSPHEPTFSHARVLVATSAGASVTLLELDADDATLWKELDKVVLPVLNADCSVLSLQFVSVERSQPAVLVAVATDGTVVVFEPKHFPAYEHFRIEPAPRGMTCMDYTADRTMLAVGTTEQGLQLYPGLPGLDIETLRGKYRASDSGALGATNQMDEMIMDEYYASTLNLKQKILMGAGFAPDQYTFVQQQIATGKDPVKIRATVGAVVAKASGTTRVAGTHSAYPDSALGSPTQTVDGSASAAAYETSPDHHRPPPLPPLSSPVSPSRIHDHRLDTSHESAPWFITNCIKNTKQYVAQAVCSARTGDYLLRYSSDNQRIVMCVNDHGREIKVQCEPTDTGYRFGGLQYVIIVIISNY